MENDNFYVWLIVGFCWSLCLILKRHLYFLVSFSPHVLSAYHVESQSNKQGTILTLLSKCSLAGETRYGMKYLNAR